MLLIGVVIGYGKKSQIFVNKVVLMLNACYFLWNKVRYIWENKLHIIFDLI